MNRIYIANAFGDNVSVIDGLTNNIIATVTVGDQPQFIDVNPSSKRVYVTNLNDNNVSVIDGNTQNVIATATVGLGPSDISVNPITQAIYVANSGITVGLFPFGIDVHP